MRALPIAALILGCVRSVPAQPPPPLGPPGTVTVTTKWTLGWPYRVRRTLLALDGAVIEGGKPVSAAPGAHTLALKAMLTVPCSAFASEPVSLVTVRATHSFSAGTDAAAVGAELYERGDVLLPIEERLAVRFRLSGAREGVRNEEPPPASCVGLGEVDREVCVLDARMERARGARDIVWLTCLNEKRKQMEPLLAAPDEAAKKKIHALAREAEQCLGEDLAYFGQAEVTVEDRCGPSIEWATASPTFEDTPRVPMPGPAPWLPVR